MQRKWRPRPLQHSKKNRRGGGCGASLQNRLSFAAQGATVNERRTVFRIAVETNAPTTHLAVSPSVATTCAANASMAAVCRAIVAKSSSTRCPPLQQRECKTPLPTHVSGDASTKDRASMFLEPENGRHWKLHRLSGHFSALLLSAGAVAGGIMATPSLKELTGSCHDGVSDSCT